MGPYRACDLSSRRGLSAIPGPQRPGAAPSGHAPASSVFRALVWCAGMWLRLGTRMTTKTVGSFQMRCGALDPSESEQTDKNSHYN